MMTPQEVSSKTFPKAVMGGYGMAAVDEFLDKLTEDYTELFKENTALKGRIKQLNEKIDEYRQIEESMRATLLAAQRMADEMTAQAKAKRDAVMQEAEEKRAELMGDAETLAQKRMAELRDLVAQEERRLEEKRREVDDAVAREQVRLDRARGAVLKFMEIARGNCQEQLKILARLETMVPPAPAAQSAPAPVQSVPAEPRREEPKEAAAPVRQETPREEPAEMAEMEPEELEEDPLGGEPAEDEELQVEEDFFTSPLPSLSALKEKMKRRGRPRDPEVDERAVEESVRTAMEEIDEDQEPLFQSSPEEETRVINLDDLQFGRNYKRDQ